MNWCFWVQGFNFTDARQTRNYQRCENSGSLRAGLCVASTASYEEKKSISSSCECAKPCVLRGVYFESTSACKSQREVTASHRRRAGTRSEMHSTVSVFLPEELKTRRHLRSHAQAPARVCVSIHTRSPFSDGSRATYTQPITLR